MTTIYVWGNNAERVKDTLLKAFRMKWSRKRRRFFRENADKRVLKKITSYCLKNRINYRTDSGQSYEVVQSELVETSSRELRDWGPDVSKGSPSLEEIDYEQMWDEYKEEEE